MKKKILLILLGFVVNLCLLNAQETDTICNLEEADDNSFLKIFPNPTKGTFQIVYGSATSCPPAGWGGIIIVNIINSKGETVYTEAILKFEGEYDQTIDLSGFEKGTYTIQVVAGKRKKTRREILE